MVYISSISTKLCHTSPANTHCQLSAGFRKLRRRWAVYICSFRVTPRHPYQKTTNFVVFVVRLKTHHNNSTFLKIIWCGCAYLRLSLFTCNNSNTNQPADRSTDQPLSQSSVHSSSAILVGWIFCFVFGRNFICKPCHCNHGTQFVSQVNHVTAVSVAVVKARVVSCVVAAWVDIFYFRAKITLAVNFINEPTPNGRTDRQAGGPITVEVNKKATIR